MGRKPLVSIGDIFEIPLSNNKKAFGQYIYWDSRQGPLIKVFNLIIDSSENIPIDRITISKELFPPVITGLMAAVRNNLWKVIGNSRVKDFVYPKFISTLWDPKTNEAKTWYLWDGEKYIRLGVKLPEEHKKLEFLIVYSPYDIPERIQTGKKPYEDLILTNKIKKP